MMYYIADGFWKNTLEAQNILVKEKDFLINNIFNPDDFVNIFDSKGEFPDFNIPCPFNYFTSNQNKEFNFNVFYIKSITNNLINFLTIDSNFYLIYNNFQQQSLIIKNLINAIQDKSSEQLDRLFPEKFNSILTFYEKFEKVNSFVENLTHIINKLKKELKGKENEVETLENYIKEIQEKLKTLNNTLSENDNLKKQNTELSNKVTELENVEEIMESNVNDLKNVNNDLTKEIEMVRTECAEYKRKYEELLQEINRMKNLTVTQELDESELQYSVNKTNLNKLIYIRCVDNIPQIEDIMAATMRRVKSALFWDSYDILTIYPKNSQKLKRDNLTILTKDNYKSLLNHKIDPNETLTVNSKYGIKSNDFTSAIRDYVQGTNVKGLLILDLTGKDKIIFNSCEKMVVFNIIVNEEKNKEFNLNPKYSIIYTNKELEDDSILRLPITDRLNNQEEFLTYLNTARTTFINKFILKLKNNE